MAFSYRNTLDSALSALPQRYSDQILSHVGEKIDKQVSQNQSLFAFSTTPEVQEMLAGEGLELSPISYMNHSHPASKMIENHLLYVSIPHLLKNESAIGLMSLREEKKKKFIKMRRFMKHGEFSAIKMFNSSIDGKDLYRYGQESGQVDFGSRISCIKDEFNQPGFNARVMLIHDELHFHSKEEILDLFSEVTQLKAIICTSVVPVELLLGETKSKNPRIYGFEVEGDSLFYFPDGNPSEGYVQSVSTSLWPLKTRSIERDGLKLRITILNSIFSHHLISIERTHGPTKSVHFFKKPSCLLRDELKILDYSLSGAQIERKTMHSILTYLSCLKSPNHESAIAKLRQLERRDLFEDELNLVANISTTFSGVKCWDGLSLSFAQHVKNSIYGTIPWLSSFVDEKGVWQVLFKNFLTATNKKWFKVDLEEVDLSKKSCLIDRMVSVCSRKQNPDEVQRQKFVGCRFKAIQIEDLVDKNQSAQNEDKRGPLLMIEYNPDLPTVERSTRTGVAMCMADVDFEPESSLKPDRLRKNSCVFRSISIMMQMDVDELISKVAGLDISDDLYDSISLDKPLSLQHIGEISSLIGRKLVCDFEGRVVSFGEGEEIFLILSNNHCNPSEPFTYSDLMKKKEIPSLGSVKWEFSISRASKLIKSFIIGNSGVMHKDPESKALAFMKKVEQIVENIESLSLSVDINYTWGAPGSGKTYSIQKFLISHPDFSGSVISPRRMLADEWVESLRGSKSSVSTFESFLGRDTKLNNFILLDELSLYPPGYVDLVILKIVVDQVSSMREPGSLKSKDFEKAIKRAESFKVIVIGDPMQARYYSENDSIILDRRHDIDIMVEKGANRTIWKTKRMESWFENLVDIKCLVRGDEFRKFTFYSGLSSLGSEKYDAILCAGQEDKIDLVGKLPVYTFGEAQGLTFDRVLIALTNRVELCSDHHLFVAITRSRKQFDFIMSSSKHPSEFVRSCERKLLGYILRNQKISRDRLSSLFSNSKPVWIEEDRIGTNIQSKAVRDIYILPFCDLSDSIEVDAEVGEQVNEPIIKQKCHLPIIHEDPILSMSFDRMKAKEMREIYHPRAGYSKQFSDLDWNTKNQIAPAPFQFEAIFPRHQNDDSVTFLAAVKKRLSFSNCRNEMNELNEKREIGSTLAEIFIGSLKNQFVIKQDDIDEGEADFIKKRLVKSEAMWENHSNRSDIDWSLDRVLLFMKSQLCTKSEKMYVDGKAGQTLACFQHIVLFKFGPMLRAIEKAFMRACGENFYVHSSKDFGALNEYVRKNSECLNNGLSIESDYEAFDASQDSLVLAFELSVMKKIGVSRSFLLDYEKLKTNLGSKLGNFSIMRFTGEFCTFLFNTWSNLLFTVLKYEVKESSRILLAGDDMASLGNLRKRDDDRSKLLALFKLKAKEDRRKNPLFCGWFLTAEGIYKKPSLLWSRLQVMNERGKLKECIDNYLLELMWGYRMGENLFDYLDEFEMACHYKCVRFFIENSHLCKGEASKMLNTFGFTYGSNDQGMSVIKKHFINVAKRREAIGVRRDVITDDPKMNADRSKEVISSLRRCLESVQPHVQRVKSSAKMKEGLKKMSPCEKEMMNFMLSMSKVKTKEAPVLTERRKPKSSIVGQTLGHQPFDILKKVSKLIERNCECLSSKSMISFSGVIKNFSELMPSAHLRFMGMQDSYIEKFLTASEGLNRILKSMVPKTRELYSQNFRCLMMMKSDGFRRRLESITIYTSGLFLLASPLCSQISSKSKELCQSLTDPWGLADRGILALMKFPLKKVLLSSVYAPLTVSLLAIRISRSALRLLLDFLVSMCRRVVNCFPLTSAYFIDLQTQLDFSIRKWAIYHGLNRRFVAQNFYHTLTRLGNLWEGQLNMSLRGLMYLQNRGEEVYSCLKGVHVQGGIVRLRRKRKQEDTKVNQGFSSEEMWELLSQRWGNLGLPRLKLKTVTEDIIASMSIQEVVRGEIRSRVERFIWENYIDPMHDFIEAANLPALPGQPTGENLTIYRRILDHVLPYLFGNIAIVGTSNKTVWPDIDVPIPEIQFLSGGPRNVNVRFAMEFTLAEFCPQLDNLRRNSTFAPMRTGTMRFLCENFASEASNFLRDRRQQGVFSNIYAKWPRAFDPAPWVAFDFAAGLNMHMLSVDERTVIDRMTKRLFRTEGQRYVFNAQGEVNMSLEG